MDIPTLIDAVDSLLTDYYSNIDTTSSSLVIGSNTISINVSGNTGSTINATQYNKLVAAVTCVGKFCLVMNYRTALRVYLAVLLGLHTSTHTTPEHFSATYACNLFDDKTIGKVTKDEENKRIQIRSTDFGSMSLDSIKSYIKNLLSEYCSDPSDYEYDKIEYVDDLITSSDSSNNSSEKYSGNEISMPIRLYYALICRYLIRYVDEYGAEKVVYVTIYSIESSMSVISSMSMVDVSIVNNEGSEIDFSQYADIESYQTFGVPELEVTLNVDAKLAIIICSIVVIFLFTLFTSLGVFMGIRTFKRIKEINFKNE